MIIPKPIDLQELANLGRNYPWDKPETCPVCKGRIWWHGFVLCFFLGFTNGVWLRRMRCPDCKTVFCFRPDTHWSRFQASFNLIYRSLEHKFSGKGYLEGLYRQTQWNWFSAMKRNGVARLGACFLSFNPDKILQGFNQILAMGYIPVSRSLASILKPSIY